MNNIVLREGLEISSNINVLVWDKISILFKKFAREEIGEIQYTLEVVKLLLIDKTKVTEIDKMLTWDIDENCVLEINDWGEKVGAIIMELTKLKKKPTQ